MPCKDGLVLARSIVSLGTFLELFRGGSDFSPMKRGKAGAGIEPAKSCLVDFRFIGKALLSVRSDRDLDARRFSPLFIKPFRDDLAVVNVGNALQCIFHAAREL